MEVRREAPLATAADRAERLQGREAVRRSGEIQRNVQVDRPQRSFEPRVVRAPGTNAEVTGARRSGGSIPGARTRESRRSVGTATIEERNLRRAPGVREPSNRDLVQQRREAPRVFEPAQRRISRTPVLGTEPPAPRTAAQRIARPERSWRTDWRKDHRYNWHDWRRRHRSHFHLGLYYDPYGWDYFRYGVGWRLWPSYYRSSYWLNDPWQYRLPPAYGPYRWVRYHYDAVLVNIYTGEVVDIVYNFFW
jgi:hypothetical protein